MDELKLSWDKKVTVREIAQFYEDKIRELDGRFQRLTEQINVLADKFEANIKELGQRAKIALDFLSKYDDVKGLIESESKVRFDSLRSLFETYQKRAQLAYEEATERIIQAQKKGNVGGMLRAQLEVDVLVSDFYRFLADHDEGYFESQHTFFKFAKTHPEVFLPVVNQYLKMTSDVSSGVALSVINGMVDDYLKMFSSIKSERDVK
jgi:hypothetical protein